MKPKARRIVLFTAIALAMLVLDQGSKAWARTLPLGEPHPVIAGYWDWVHAENPGSAFSTFVGGTGARVVLSLLATAAIAGLGVMAWRTRPEQRLPFAAYALLAGGALGNLVDRVRTGTVTDFVRWHLREHMWPIFNVADAVLLAGALLLLFAGLRAAPSAPARSVAGGGTDPRLAHEDHASVDRGAGAGRLHE